MKLSEAVVDFQCCFAQKKHIAAQVIINKVKAEKRKGTGGEGRDERGGGIQLPQHQLQ